MTLNVADDSIQMMEDEVFVFPTSFAQARLWFFDQLEPGSPQYNISVAVRLEGLLNLAVLEQSLNAIVQRHEVLRTTFGTMDGQPVQVIAPHLTLSLPVVDLRGLPNQEQEAEVQRRIAKDAQRPFDLSKSPLLRTTLLQLNEQTHILLLVMHHIISDGWSMGVLVHEVSTLYDAFAKGCPSPLPELPIQYADFAVWQREWLQGEVLETQQSYWKQQLRGNLPVLQLPTERSRPSVQTGQGATQFFRLTPNLSEALKILSQREGVTLFMTLLAGFKTLLYRYTQQHDILVGSSIANRNRAETEQLIGVFVNTLVMRTDLSGTSTFRELLHQVREVALEAYEHQDLPFEQLVEEPERSLSHHPVFQVWFALNNAPIPDLKLPGLTASLLEVKSDTAKFDLSLDMMETAEGLMGSVEYSTDLFDAATISRMVGHFLTLLEGIVANPQVRLGDLPLLTAAERHQLLVQWNNAQLDYPKQFIHHRFEAQVKQSPESVAVVFGDQLLTYRELNQRANKLAHHLQKLGVEPEVKVGIYMERSVEMIVAVLGVLKAGGAYVPLDPQYSQKRLAFMVNNTQVPVLLTQQRLVEALPNHETQVVCWDSTWESICHESDENPINRATPENLAYVIYTSGSTGQPKGVMVTHGSLVNAYLAWEKAYSLRSVGTCHLQMASFSFDVFSGDWVRALCSGAKLVLCPRELLLEPPKLYQLMRQERVDCAEFVPAVLMNLLPYLEETQQSLDFMRLLVVGSDNWSVQGCQEVKRFCGLQTRLINSYGVSEATIDSSYFDSANLNGSCDRLLNTGAANRSVPIGRPFDNSQIYLLDAHLQLVSLGVPGELYIGGAGLARGYLNRPDLTAEKFIPHPFSKEPGARLYKTGDLARYLPDGTIEFLGRADDQVKIRGFRIELGEIEAVLSQYRAIREAVVLVREEDTGHKRLVAYVVWSSKPHLKPQETTTREWTTQLRNFLKERLPEYMVPSSFLFLDALPLTPNGKIDRRSLPAPEPLELASAAAVESPRNPVEKTLARVWSQVLGVKRVGIHDNFFELGGDSILSIQVIAKAHQVGLQLTPKQLFVHQTIAELATVVNTSQEIRAEQEWVTGSVALTPIQHDFFEQNLRDRHHWNQALLLEVRQSLDPNVLEQAVRQLLVHHDALHLRFEPTASGWRQFNAPPDDIVPFSWVDLSGLPPDEQASALEAAATQLQTSLHLTNGPLVRVAFFNLGAPHTNRLLVAIHHLVVDGVSWRILVEDLETTYQQLSRGEAVTLPPKTTSFKEWSQTLGKYANSTALQQELDYWLTSLSQPSFSLPVDYCEGVNTVASAHNISVVLSVAETQALLQEVPSVYRTQINDVLLTALVQTFAQWTGASSLLVNLEGHGREEIFNEVDLSRTVGWFTSMFPVLLDLGDTSHPGEALKTVKEQLRRIPNRGIGYGLLRYLSDRPETVESLSQLPKAEVVFNYLGQFDQTLSESSLFRLAQESSGPERSLRDKRSELLEINGFVVGSQLRVDWTYSQAIHCQSTIERVAQGFLDALRSLIAHCQSPNAGGYTPSDFPLTTLNQHQLNTLLQQEPQLEDIYPLSPIQQGMLFHSLYAPKSDAYFTQTQCTLYGTVHLSAFEQAWQHVVERHSILRTAFVWQGFDREKFGHKPSDLSVGKIPNPKSQIPNRNDTPLQIVVKRVCLPYEYQDWRGLTASEKQVRLEAFLQIDRDRGFDLAVAPLMRLTLLQLTDDTYQIIWSHHHILLDGWSTPLLLKEVFALYQAFSDNQTIHLEPSRPFRDYMAWLQQQNLSDAETYWRQALKGFTTPTTLGRDRNCCEQSLDQDAYHELECQLSTATTTALQSFARQHQLTINTLVQGAWALLLSYYSDRDDVVFGATLSSRPAVLAGAESMVGLFINTLPVRVQVPSQQSLLPWLQHLQTQQVEARQYDYTPLAQIQGWSEVPRGIPLFETLAVFENYPDEPFLQENSDLEIRDARTALRNHYPLTIRATLGSKLSLLVMCDSPRGTAKGDRTRIDAARIAKHFETLLPQFVQQPHTQLSTFKNLLIETDKQQQILQEQELEQVSFQKFKQTKRKAIRQ